MPTLAERLSPSSTEAQIKAAITASIQQLMNEGSEQDQAVAIVMEQVKKATGKGV